MILLDFNQVMLSSVFAQSNFGTPDVSEDMIRHMFLNSLRMNRHKFFQTYGEIVICADGGNSWRRDYFDLYKFSRRKKIKESAVDWNQLFTIINTIRDEMKEVFPYPVLHFDRVEADDIIGVLANRFGATLNNGTDKILILSGDKDFVQLQKYANVYQYDPTRKKEVRTDNPGGFLFEHILKGDSSDGVPNVLSPDNSIAEGIRQKPLSQKRIEEFRRIGREGMDATTMARFDRNRILIDLDCVPQTYQDMINADYDRQMANPKGRDKLFNHFIKHRLKHLMADINQF